MISGKKKLGDLLVENNIIGLSQLQEALEVQKQTGMRLGQVLINLGYLTDQDIIDVLEEQLGIPQAKLGNVVLTPEIMLLIPEKLVLRHKVIPLKKEGNKITVAMVDPLNVLLLDDLQIATGFQIEPIMASKKDIDTAIKKFYGFQDLMDRAKKEFEVMPNADTSVFDLDNVPDVLIEEAPTIRIVNSLIQKAIQERASDIHIEPYSDKVRVRYRVDGILRDIMNLPRQSLASVVSRIKIMSEMDIAERRLPLDGRIQVKTGEKNIDLRISTLPTIFGEKVVIRILDKSAAILKMEDLGTSSNIMNVYNKIIRYSYGMILITGPTGSGKTTTLYSTLHAVNSPEKNVITIEDPVEYVLDGINQINVHERVGLTFATGLRSILRQDPDIIMVGEIRDGETADIAVRAATTGHFVLSTLHTNDAAGALPRLIDMGVEPFLVASSVIAVMAQRLVRKICPKCKKEYELAQNSMDRKFLELDERAPITLYKGTGCNYCGHTGYRGRQCIQELLPVTQVQRDLVQQKAPADVIFRSALNQGMITMKQDGIKKVLSGVTTVEELIRVILTENL